MILSIDYGTKKIGLAMADEKIKIALPYSVLSNTARSALISELKKICQQESVLKIVVGLPRRTDTGKWETGDAFRQELQKFIDDLRKSLRISIKTFDERLTSKMAEQLISKQTDVSAPKDAVAAMIILQDYLLTKNLRL